MLDALVARINDRRTRLAELDRERAALEGEIRAYEDVMVLVSGVKPAMSARQTAHAAMPERPARIGREASDRWMATLAGLFSRGLPSFDIDTVMDVSRELGFAPTRGNIRSQMATFVNRDMLTRLGLGRFSFTDEGMGQVRHHMERNVVGRHDDDAPWADQPRPNLARPEPEPPGIRASAAHAGGAAVTG